MDQILLIGLGDTGTSTVEAAAEILKSNKIRVNSGRICCASIITKEYSDYSALKGTIAVTADDMAPALDTLSENADGKVKVILTASLAGICKDICIKTVDAVKAYFANKNRNIEITGIFILPDVIISSIADDCTDAMNVIRTSADSVKSALTDKNDPVFDRIYFVGNESVSGKVYPDMTSCISSVARMIYLAFISGLSEEFSLREKAAAEKVGAKPLCGMLGLSKAAYTADTVAQYCGLRGCMDIINALWIAIDREIAERYPGRTLPTAEFRKEYVSVFEEKLAEKDMEGNFFPKLEGYLYNDTVTLNEDNSENHSYSHKVDDFVTITDRLIDIFSSEVKAEDCPAYTENDAEGVIRDMNEAALKVASRLMVNAVPLCKATVNRKNDASVFGLISNENGDIPEERNYSHPVVARYLYYKLSDRLNEIYNGVDILASADGIRAAFEGEGDKAVAVNGYLKNAVRLAFIKLFNEKLEKLINQFDDFFAALPSVWDHFDAQLQENILSENSLSPAEILLNSDPYSKAVIYNSRPLPMNGQPPVGPGIVDMIASQFFFGEDPFNNVDSLLAKNDPVYSLEYNLGASYKKYYARNKDATVGNDIYNACGMGVDPSERDEVCKKTFTDMVSALVSAASPALEGPAPSLLWPISPGLADKCPCLGEIFGVDVSKYTFRSFDKAVLECFATVYGIDTEKL